jgi:universal stress protein A
MNVKRILFPTDLSDCSLAALDYSSDLASSWTAELHILYVDDLTDLVAMAAYSCPSFVASSARDELKECLQAIKPTLANLPCRYHYAEGVPANEICALAKEEKIDLIVMSSHGRTGLSRVLVGSVAEQVLRWANCPVLVIKQSAKDRANTAAKAGRSHIANVEALTAGI